MAEQSGDTSMTQPQEHQSAQTGTSTTGEIHNMRVSDLVNLANQQNLDVSALNDLIGQIQVDPNVGNVNTSPPKG